VNIKVLTYKNIRFYTRYYKLVAFSVLITVAVIVGSLSVGDSVRTTLVKRVSERLGDTQTIVFSRNSFMSEKFAGTPLFGGSARAILLTNGFISQNGKLIPVFVWGVNDLSIAKGAARINPALLKELGQNSPDAVVLRLPATGLVPSGSLFVTENYTTSMRLNYDGTVEAKDGGNLSLKNEQMLPFNVFVNRNELAETLEIEGKINLIFTNKEIDAEELRQVWNYSLSGLSVLPCHSAPAMTIITSDRVFLQDTVVETICKNNPTPNRIFSYMANSIKSAKASPVGRFGGVIPYSFVTAVDRYKNQPLQKEDIILSDYAARRLNVGLDDSVSVSYFVSQQFKTLKEKSICLKVSKIVPLKDLTADKTLIADFPGLSDVERCTDWNSDLPINMNLITDEDENYWKLYRNTPKALIAYNAVVAGWRNAYGNATAVCVDSDNPDLSELKPEMFGIQIIHPREKGLYAAMNGVDFSSLFLALGFFIIVSAILLMLIPISEMLYQRRHEIELFKAMGYTKKRITRILLLESAPVVLLSSIAGVIAGFIYTTGIMYLLGNVWKGATHTEGFSVYPSAITIISGFLIGIVLSMLLLLWVIVKNLKDRKPDAEMKRQSLKKKKILASVLTAVACGTIVLNFLYLHSVILFVFIGIIFIGTAAIWGDYLICRTGSGSAETFNSDKMIWSTLFANRKQAVLSFFALTTGVFIVFSVGLNRKSFSAGSQLRTGTGGFSLWAESSVPVYYDLSSKAGREKTGLTNLPDDTEILQCLRYNADDASCLNLNKVTTPAVLGLNMNVLAGADFQIEQNIYSHNKKSFFERIREKSGEAYPALVDATVLTWGLMKQLGDTLWYVNDHGQKIPIRLAGTLSNSVFQGNILIDRHLFSEIWNESAGSEVFLIKAKETEKENVKASFSQALNEYGVRVSATNERLKQFNSVTDTYLTIFLTFGSLGLLLGIMSFIIVIRKNLSARHSEIDLYRTLGFPDSKIEQTLYKENLLVPLYAIAVGVTGSLIGVGINLLNIGIWIGISAFLFTVLFVACIVVFVGKEVRLMSSQSGRKYG